MGGSECKLSGGWSSSYLILCIALALLTLVGAGVAYGRKDKEIELKADMANEGVMKVGKRVDAIEEVLKEYVKEHSSDHKEQNKEVIASINSVMEVVNESAKKVAVMSSQMQTFRDDQSAQRTQLNEMSRELMSWGPRYERNQ